MVVGWLVSTNHFVDDEKKHLRARACCPIHDWDLVFLALRAVGQTSHHCVSKVTTPATQRFHLVALVARLHIKANGLKFHFLWTVKKLERFQGVISPKWKMLVVDCCIQLRGKKTLEWLNHCTSISSLSSIYLGVPSLAIVGPTYKPEDYKPCLRYHLIELFTANELNIPAFSILHSSLWFRALSVLSYHRPLQFRQATPMKT